MEVKLKYRGRMISAQAEARGQNIRFLVLPRVTVANRVSRLLSRMAKPLAADWERIYGHWVYSLESFVDPGRFRGSSYRAGNWISLGLRLGLGKHARSKRANHPRKQILGYPLDPRFGTLLCEWT
jgi:hypothetical protein